MYVTIFDFSRGFSPSTTTTTTARIVRKGTQHNRGTVGLWIAEGNFVLYLVSRTTCKVGLSCRGNFLSLVRLSGLVLRSSLVILN